jgi:hypothetical protein
MREACQWYFGKNCRIRTERSMVLVTQSLNYKARLAQLGKTQSDLQNALAERGYDITPQNLSRYVRGDVIPRNTDVLGTIHLIILRWEKERK